MGFWQAGGAAESPVFHHLRSEKDLISWTHRYLENPAFAQCLRGAASAASESVAADVDGLQVCHLHDINATAGQACDAFGADCLHGHHVSCNEGGWCCPGSAFCRSTWIHGDSGDVHGHAVGHTSLLVLVGLDVLGEVVTPHEAFWTLWAGKLLLS